MLSKPIEGETLFLYVATSESAVSGVLIREEGGEQKPIYYVSRSLIDAKTRYPVMEKLELAVVTGAQKMRRYPERARKHKCSQTLLSSSSRKRPMKSPEPINGNSMLTEHLQNKDPRLGYSA